MISPNDFKYYKKGQIVPRSICEAKSKIRRHARFAMDVCVVGNKNIIAVKDSGEKKNVIIDINVKGDPDITFKDLCVDGNGFLPIVIRLIPVGKGEPTVRVICSEFKRF